MNFNPKKSFNCPITIVTAIPEVKPVVMLFGIYLIRLPIRRMPIKISIIPAMIVAIARPSRPFVATIPATIVGLIGNETAINFVNNYIVALLLPVCQVLFCAGAYALYFARRGSRLII